MAAAAVAVVAPPAVAAAAEGGDLDLLDDRLFLLATAAAKLPLLFRSEAAAIETVTGTLIEAEVGAA